MLEMDDEKIPVAGEQDGSFSREMEAITVPEQVEDVAEVEDVESLKKLLDEERDRSEKYLANWQRAQADLVNYKKLSEQERKEAAQFGNTLLILDLVPVLDDLERALSSVPPNLTDLTWVDGIRLIYRKLCTNLESMGLSPIKALGEAFDPRFHEAVMGGEGEEGKVVEEVQKGYKLHDRVIRPAGVVVGEGKKKYRKRKDSREGEKWER
jgi:molecular chaperone GrpE